MFSSWLGISNSHLIYLTKRNSSIPAPESFFQEEDIALLFKNRWLPVGGNRDGKVGVAIYK